MFETELQYFISHQEDLVRQHPGEVLVIKGEEVLGAYPSALEALLRTQEQHEPGSFMIQPCEPGPGAYTVTVRSLDLYGPC